MKRKANAMELTVTVLGGEVLVVVAGGGKSRRIALTPEDTRATARAMLEAADFAEAKARREGER